jgi:hypothetical protein
LRFIPDILGDRQVKLGPEYGKLAGRETDLAYYSEKNRREEKVPQKNDMEYFI